MDDRELHLEQEFRRLAGEDTDTSAVASPETFREIRRRRRGRTAVAASMAAVAVAGVAWASVAVATRDDNTATSLAPAQEVPAVVCEDGTEDVVDCATPTPDPPAPTEATNAVLVYQLREGEDPYTKGSYAPAPRVAGGDQSTQGRLRAALQELVKGPTPQEEAAGFASVFSPKTADILRSVRVGADGAAAVEFADFRDELPNASAAEGGTVMIFELNQTVFQFPDVESVEYRIGDSCAAFWEFFQGACTVVTRADVENAP